MKDTCVERGGLRRDWRFYVIGGISFLLTLALAFGVVWFWKDIRQASAYGYAGVFFVGVLCGVSIIPAPTLLLVFSLGGVLNPVYVGLIAGLGGAIGGITVYLTGAGVETIVSKVQFKKRALEYQPGSDADCETPAKHGLWAKSEAVYSRIARWVGGKGGSWAIFITSAMVISPFYFAGLAAGTLRMGLMRFFLLSWAGKTVRYLIVAFAGDLGFRFLLKWIGG